MHQNIQRDSVQSRARAPAPAPAPEKERSRENVSGTFLCLGLPLIEDEDEKDSILPLRCGEMEADNGHLTAEQVALFNSRLFQVGVRGVGLLDKVSRHPPLLVTVEHWGYGLDRGALVLKGCRVLNDDVPPVWRPRQARYEACREKLS